MSPVTLLSDFGLQDASAAMAKGVLMQHIPAVPIVDISHLVEPFNIQQAAYLLLSAYRNFPKGSCHVLLFDVFSERDPRLMLCTYDGHYFMAPDNGILSLAFGLGLEEVWRCQRLPASCVFDEWLHEIGRTLADLQSKPATELGLERCGLKISPQHWLPRIDGDVVECHVVHIDRFENVVINLTRQQFDDIGQGRPFRIQWLRGDEVITKLSTHFYDVRESAALCRFNAAGFLEICINRGKAASLFGFKLYREKQLIYNSIKIYFG